MGPAAPADDTIRRKLLDLAREQEVRILHAVEAGSRAWGFASPDSDFDVRFIFVRPVAHYLRLTPRRDVIQPPIENDLDFVGWDLFKALRLLRRSNPSLLEHLGSPIRYMVPGTVMDGIRDQAREHGSLRACGEQYLSMAKSHVRAHVLGRDRVIRKKYLYALRAVVCCAWLLEQGSFPPTVFEESLAGITMPGPVRSAVAALLADKRENREMDEGPAVPELQAYLSRAMDELPGRVGRLPARPFPEEPLDALLSRAILAP